MGLLEDIGYSIVDSLTLTLRRFAAFIFIIFALGVAYGAHLSVNNPTMLLWAIAVPLVLAAVAYVSTWFSVVVFVVFAIAMLLL
ncbi:hypothetical protein HY995_04025 [Candidatus Micrarchaeota archaeon]|nr:hypothetical protein [Candidatus Micrarchaeota archaeon]MBI5177225.1 hypothetical protein [Candidatus Micrarchaeota archaeon]